MKNLFCITRVFVCGKFQNDKLFEWNVTMQNAVLKWAAFIVRRLYKTFHLQGFPYFSNIKEFDSKFYTIRIHRYLFFIRYVVIYICRYLCFLLVSHLPQYWKMVSKYTMYDVFCFLNYSNQWRNMFSCIHWTSTSNFRLLSIEIKMVRSMSHYNFMLGQAM